MTTTFKRAGFGNFLQNSMLILLGIVFSCSTSFAGTRLWQLKTPNGYVDASPGVGDLDRDGINDLVLCTTAGQIMAVNSNGQKIWTYETNVQISNPSTLADLNGDNKLEILAITNPGKVVCLDGKNGKHKWDFDLPAIINWGTTSLAVGNLVNDKKMEIIAVDSKGHLTCLDYSGKQLWQTKIEGNFNTCPAIADLDGDGENEILAGSTTFPLICFSSNGKELWHLKGKSSGTSPQVYDLDNDNKPEIVTACAENLTVLDNKGEIIWQYAMEHPIHDGVSIGDIDLDGIKEIIAVDLMGNVVTLDNKGKLQWTANVYQKARRSPTIADIDGDSKLEILIAGNDSHLYVFSAEGDLVEEIQLSGKCNSSPTIVDFRNNGNLAVICPSASDVSAYSWAISKTASKPIIQFSEYRGNSARTGTTQQLKKPQTAHIASIGYGDMYVAKNNFTVTVENPEKKKLTIELSIIENNSTPLFQTAAFQDSSFNFKLAYTLNARNAVNLQFIAKLKQGKQTISEIEKSFYIIPYAKDMADIKSILADIQSLLPQLPESKLVANQSQLLEFRLTALQEKTQVAGTLDNLQRIELREQVASLHNDAMTLQKMTEAAINAGTSLAVYAANPWAPFGNCDEIIEGRTDVPNVSIYAFAGETESAAFNLANFSDKPIFIRIEPDAFISEKDSSSILASKAMTLHEVIDVPTEMLDKSGDALPLLGQGQTLMIPQWGLRQLWININTTALNPGVWKSAIRIRSMEIESKEAVANLVVNVSKIALPAKQELNLCHWGYVHTSILKDIPQLALDDQVSHGTNVFVATNNFSPKAKFDNNGNIIGEIDFSKHDEYMKAHSPHGTILFFNYQHSLSGPAKPFDPVWEKAHAEWLKAWFNHMKTLGIDYKDYALYPIDEPGLHEGLVEKFISYSKVIRKVDERVQIYTDPVGKASMEDLEKMAPYVDIWCPNRNDYLLDIGADKLAFIKTTNKTIWTYACDGNAKHQSPLGYYRAQAWLADHHDLTGIGFWSYCTSRYNPWFTPVGGNDYLLIYQGVGVVASKRWEAIRDGVEDYSMLQLLKQAVNNAKDADPQTKQAAQKLLTTDAFEIAAFCGWDADGTQPTNDGMSVLRKVEDARWQKIQSTRKEIITLLENLNK